MNEAGLVIEVMWLESTRYPAADARPALDGLQWIQYQLDQFATVAEVVAHADAVRVASPYGKLHYLLTNSSYAESAAFLRKHTAAVGTGSLQRFARAAGLVEKRVAGDPVAAAFGILEQVSQGAYSKWNLVYEPAQKRVWFRSRGAWDIKTVSLRDFDANCQSPVAALDLATPGKGEMAARFRPYDPSQNRRLVEQSLAPLRSILSPGAVDALAGYPASCRCDGATPSN
jgi:choloylglycine hydrolase